MLVVGEVSSPVHFDFWNPSREILTFLLAGHSGGPPDFLQELLKAALNFLPKFPPNAPPNFLQELLKDAPNFPPIF